MSHLADCTACGNVSWKADDAARERGHLIPSTNTTVWMAAPTQDRRILARFRLRRCLTCHAVVWPWQRRGFRIGVGVWHARRCQPGRPRSFSALLHPGGLR